MLEPDEEDLPGLVDDSDSEGEGPVPPRARRLRRSFRRLYQRQVFQKVLKAPARSYKTKGKKRAQHELFPDLEE